MTTLSHDLTSQTSKVLRPADLPSKNRGGGCSTVPLVTYARGGTAFLNGTTAFEPGAQIAHHLHNVVESVVVVQGRAIVDIDGERLELDTFDTTLVPANVPHHFENASPDEPMRILWTYASTDATRTILDSGEHGRIDDESATQDGPSAADSIVEVVTLRPRPGAEDALEEAVAEAAPLFQHAPGARTFELRRRVEEPGVYDLHVRWETLDDHLQGFRSSDAFNRWRELVMPHLSEPPSALHHRHVLTAF